MLEPSTTVELQECVRSRRRLIAVGGGTKRPLWTAGCDGAETVSTSKLAGITEYEPGEFTFTARAGTPLREIGQALSAHGQYLPFDPPLTDAGATIGGTVSAGLSGPGAFRFGGVRDFILGAVYVDGRGRALRVGGKVVKNAAGFDVPKFLTGSLGRFGVIAEVTFKVFPRPPRRYTLRVHKPDPFGLMQSVAGRPFDTDALVYDATSGVVLARFPGTPPETAVTAIDEDGCSETLGGSDATSAWGRLREFAWGDDGAVLVKVPLTPVVSSTLERQFAASTAVRRVYDLGGNVAYLSGEFADIAAALETCGLTGLVIGGDSELAWCPRRDPPAIERRLKQTFDPGDKFPAY